MFWQYVEKKFKTSLYPDLYHWDLNLPKIIKKKIYKKYGFNIQFAFIPEYLSTILYYWYFGKYKNYYYPTNKDIKFFYFTLFKKNGFIFLIICTIIYNNFFLDLLFLLIKSFIVFYLTLYVIYIIFLIQKFIYISMKILFNICFKYYPTLILFVINYFLNVLFNYKKKKWYF